MIGITKLSSGRMGNRLFHYHFLRQIAKETGLDYFHCKFPDSAYFGDMEKRSRPFFQFKRAIRITSKEVLSFAPQDFLSFVMRETDDGKNVIFDPPMLGEVFFDYLFYSPNEFIKVKDQYKINFTFDSSNRMVVGVHFRGTDFPDWNEHAALKFPYYRDAILYCLDRFKNENPVFVLFTDDPKYPAFLETVTFLQALGKVAFYLGDDANLPIYDFYQMSQCDVLISSPSTFAIFAGCLGKPKRIIHAKSWLDYAVDHNDTFWVKLKDTANPYYAIWKIF